MDAFEIQTNDEALARNTDIGLGMRQADDAVHAEQSAVPLVSSGAAHPTQEERFIGMVAHLIPLLNFALPVLLPLALLMLLEVFFRRNRFLARHIEQAMTFQFFYFVIALAVLSVLLGQVHCLALAPFLALYGIVSNLRGARAAWRGESYRYPLTWRLIRAQDKE